MSGRDASSWRNRVSDNFEKRRQTPKDNQKNLVKMTKKLGAKRPIRLPKLQAPGSPSNALSSSLRFVENLNSGSDVKSFNQSLQKSPERQPRKPTSGKKPSGSKTYSGRKASVPALGQLKEDKKRALMSLPHGIPANQEYKLVARDPDELYLTQRSHLDTLPLELFDSEETDRTPDEWVNLGGPGGTPAFSKYFVDREWTWRACKVVGYNSDSRRYVISFNDLPNSRKEIPRLNLRFEEESEQMFNDRVNACKKLKEECLGIRRYTAFINSQPQSIFSSIRQSTLQGILGKLMTNSKSEKLVMGGQRSVEELLMEVGDEYGSCMKRVVIEHRRRIPEENKKLELLGLPPLPEKPRCPQLAVIEIKERSKAIRSVSSQLKDLHYLRHRKAGQVVRQVYTEWFKLTGTSFIDIEGLQLPMTLVEYRSQQEEKFDKMLNLVNNEWRSTAVELIKSKLNDTFTPPRNKLNETIDLSEQMDAREEYDKSDMKRFLKMVTLMLRTQLSSVARNSMLEYIEFISQYSSRDLKLADFETKDFEEVENDYKDIENVDITEYLEGPRAGQGGLRDIPSLFVFKMSTLKNKVVFIPDLRSIESSLLNLINIPNKLAQKVHEIEHEIVEKFTSQFSIPQCSLCTRDNSVVLFQVSEQAKHLIKTLVDENLREPLALAKLYQKYANMLDLDIDEYVNEWFGNISEEKKAARIAELKAKEEARIRKAEEEALANPGKKKIKTKRKGAAVMEAAVETQFNISHTLKETELEIQKFLDLIESVRNLSPLDVSFRMVTVECQNVKEQLILRAQEMVSKLQEGLATEIRKKNQELSDEFNSMLVRLKQQSSTVQDLSEVKKLADRIEKNEIKTLRTALADLDAKTEVLHKFNFSVSREDFNLGVATARYPINMIIQLDYTKQALDADKKKFAKTLELEQQAFLADQEEWTKEVDLFINFGWGSNTENSDSALAVEKLNDKLTAATPLVASFNEREEIFGNGREEYSELIQLQTRCKPYYQLWVTCYSSYYSCSAAWTTRPLTEMDADQVASEIESWFKGLTKLEREFKAQDATKPLLVAQTIKAEIAAFRQYVPFIRHLRNPGLRERHWEQLSREMCPNEKPLDPEKVTLQELQKHNLENYAHLVEDISVKATKEYALDQALTKMKSEWKDMEFQLDDMKGTDTFILKKTEDILTLLDDQILKTQSIRGSPYIKHFEAESANWEENLHNLSNVMEQWLTCQKAWMYLVPIFLLSPDIGQKMAQEYRSFKDTHAFWKKTMSACKRNPSVREFVIETENFLSNLRNHNAVLAWIGKKLNKYLDTKRSAFARFYFLSNDELLEILAQAKNPLAVQPHLSKCFDGINQLVFTDKFVITHIQSKEKERVKLQESVDPTQPPRQGNVEIWLKDVESLMKVSLKNQLRVCMKDHTVSKRTKWLLSHPGQLVLSVDQIMWTNQMVQALEGEGKKGLIKVQQEMHQDMMDLIELIRGDLTPLDRDILNPVTVIDVHARDVMKNLIKVGVDNVGHFDWLAQMRYTWDPLDAGQMPNDLGPDAWEDGNLIVRMINTSQTYGWEYLGNSMRLVITPLTDRCYRTLMGAVHLCLGGAPEGPAGTGKTETVKDLAKALAIQCIVTNCSDAMNFQGMQVFFTGLAQTGAWACFDEFNRIKLEVLSVIAQQVSTLQKAIQAKQNMVLFGSENIPIVHTMAAFITMNPSEGGAYAGRAELPDNLKVLFRTVAMMIPDYAMIAEICLYAYGYSEATSLASKIVGCLRLSNEQLSSQQHYDFGMRAVKSVLTAAGNGKRRNPDKSEAMLTLQAIKDVNVPKFVAADLPLFSGICRDLFPGVELENSTPEVLENQIKKSIATLGLQYTPVLYKKIVELHDTIMVRHGLMIVGDTNSSKSCLIKVLQHAFTKLDGTGKFTPTTVKYINPKSLSMQDLYGWNDPVAQEWFQGVLPVVMQNCKELCVNEGRWAWMVFDGPVDAVWIENMNTVLDDNKKLCLANGAQIRLEDKMRMIFQAENLKHASPATVSRCGMVYTESQGVEHGSLLQSWLDTLPTIMTPFLEEFRSLFKWLVPACLYYVQKHMKVILDSGPIQMINSVQKLFVGQLDELLDMAGDLEELEEQEEERDRLVKIINDENLADEPDAKPVNPETSSDSRLIPFKTLSKQRNVIESKVATLASRFESAFCFATIWGVGCIGDNASQIKFSQFFKAFIQGLETEELEFELIWPDAEERESYVGKKVRMVDIPADDRTGAHKNVFDYRYDFKKNTWTPWMDTVPDLKIPATARFHEIVVPTLASVRLASMVQLCVTHQYHVLVTGATGTGKTLTLQTQLLQHLPKDEYVPLLMGFCAQTTATQVQNNIDSKLDRRRAGMFGPPPGMHCVILVDDLNMPLKEEYGAQPPIELLRQWMDYGGWYDIGESKAFKSLVDLQFVAAMPPPVAGAEITARFLRHFINLVVNPYDNNNLKSLFATIIKWWMGDLPPRIASLKDALVNATVGLYSSVTAPDGLRPTPLKSHYTFNLRDVAKVLQGVCTVEKKSVGEPKDLQRLWIHESHRVFRDRLMDEADHKHFDNILAKTMKDEFNTDVGRVMEPGESLIFVDFQDALNNPDIRPYKEVPEMDSFKKVCNGFLAEHNTINVASSMNLVLFQSAMEHVARVCRILSQPRGNALLVGVGGSGRQSCSRLAAFISSYDVMTIEVTKNYGPVEWREDMRKVMKRAGLGKTPLMFMLTDDQIKSESFVEDVNSILNDGEVPNLFDQTDEKQAVLEAVREDAAKVGQSGSPTAMFKYFVDRCKENLHVVLCLSPIGEQFRTRLRQYPSLVNCTSIDWFHPWPEEALKSVANKFVGEEELSPEVLDGIVNVCVDMQTRVTETAIAFKNRLRRQTYVTPSSYLSLIQIFRQLYSKVKGKTFTQEQRYAKGYAKLISTEAQVTEMKAELEAMRPKLALAQDKTKKLIVTLQAKTEQVEGKKAIVAVEEKDCKIQQDGAAETKAECTLQLAAAEPALEEAKASLNGLKVSFVDELMKNNHPTPGVVITLKAMCLINSVPHVMIKDPKDNLKKIRDYVNPCKKHLLSKRVGLINDLLNFDKDNIPASVMTQVHTLQADDAWDLKKINNASAAAGCFATWIGAMVTYDRILKIVQPKRDELALAESKLAKATAQLNLKKDELKGYQDELDELAAGYKKAVDERDDLEFKSKQCADRLIRANSLMSGLGGEKVRWAQKAKDYGDDLRSVTGNVLVCSGIIAYLGPYTIEYRQACVTAWVELLAKYNIPCSDNFSLEKVLGEPVTIQNWQFQKLPKDAFSTENAIIVTTALQTPLIIDPQEQASAWIKLMCEDLKNKDRSIRILKPADDGFVRTLSLCVSSGTPVLLENVGQTLDPVLEPILLKQFYVENRATMIKLGGEGIPYDTNFKLYMTTKLGNPHYLPEISTKVALVNFMATPRGLEDQMLGTVVSVEQPELEKKLNELVKGAVSNQLSLQKIEAKILEQLQNAEGNLLDNEALVQDLGRSKEVFTSIEKKAITENEFKEKVNAQRAEYKGLASSVANLYFCIASLSQIDPMYQFSLQFFVRLFIRATQEYTGYKKDIPRRTENIKKLFKTNLYLTVQRSLFARDKLLFSFLLYLQILRGSKTLDNDELRFFLTGGTLDLTNLPRNPTELKGDEEDNGEPKESRQWLSEMSWAQMQNLDKLPALSGFKSSFVSHLKSWKAYYDHPDPFSIPLPDPWGKKKLTFLQQLCILRVLRLDKCVPAMRTVVSNFKGLGPKFVNSPPFDLQPVFEESSNTVPIVFVLSSGVDPLLDILALAEEQGMASSDKLVAISLGQGQEAVAETAIREAVEAGTWVVLQNCHLLVGWLPQLEKLVDEIDPETTHDGFRLWLTSMPTPEFPVSVLQNSLKLTNEPPKGMKANMAGSLSSVTEEFLVECKQNVKMSRLHYALCFFHATVQERRKFGPLGWNRVYEFNNSDLTICRTQLRMFLDMYDYVPYQCLHYLFGELNYGGRVTDDWDRRNINCILKGLINDDIFEPGQKFDPEGLYTCPFPPEGTPLEEELDFFRNHVESFPAEDTSLVFGLHDNVNIVTAIAESQRMFETCLLLSPSENNGAGNSKEDMLSALATDIESKLPEQFDIEKAARAYPVEYNQSMNTVLVQELMRYNILTNIVKITLANLKAGMRGDIVMTEDLEIIANDLYDGKVPRAFRKYRTMKPLAAWVVDLLKRLEFLNTWLKEGSPNVYWMSGFFFTQSFLTGTLQNFARNYQIPINELEFDFTVMGEVPEDSKEAPKDGCYICGLFMAGARWDRERLVITESYKRVLYDKMPVIWFKPIHQSEVATDRAEYLCPVFNTSERRGTLTTTGVSDNYVIAVKLPSDKESAHWTRRAVALLCQLDY